MRVPKKPESKKAVEELAEFLNMNLSRCCPHVTTIPGPQLRGRAALGSIQNETILEEQVEHGTTNKPLSAEQFAKAFAKLSCFWKWREPAIVPTENALKLYKERAPEIHAVQQALNFILRPLATAKTSDAFAVGVHRVMEFLNHESWFIIPSITREYFEYISRDDMYGRPVDETLPAMRWRMEPKVRSNGRVVGWELNPYTSGIELYPVTMTILAEAAIRGDLMDLKRCAWEQCQKFFVLKKQPGAAATFCSPRCRVDYFNFLRVKQKRFDVMYKKMCDLARLKVPFTDKEQRLVETYMATEFDSFKSAVRSGNPKPKLSIETRVRFEAPRPKKTSPTKRTKGMRR